VTFEGHFSSVVTLCVQLTRDLLAIAKFLVHFANVYERQRVTNTALNDSDNFYKKNTTTGAFVRLGE